MKRVKVIIERINDEINKMQIVRNGNQSGIFTASPCNLLNVAECCVKAITYAGDNKNTDKKQTSTDIMISIAKILAHFLHPSTYPLISPLMIPCFSNTNTFMAIYSGIISKNNIPNAIRYTTKFNGEIFDVVVLKSP